MISLKKTFISFVFLIFFLITSSQANILSLGDGAYISFFEGTNTNSSSVIKTYEGTPLPSIWEGLGYLQFCSSDQRGEYNGIAMSGSAPSSGDFEKIKISFIAQWNNSSSGAIEELILAQSNFNDSSVIKDIYKVGSQGDNPIPGGESYSFKIDMRSLVSGSNNKLFSLYCDEDDKKYFKLFLRVTYPFENFTNKGNYTTKIKESPKRKAIVIDTVTPVIEFLTPGEDSFPMLGTSGDPIPETNLTVKIFDSNPNQVMKNVYLTIGGQSYTMSLVSENRNYSPGVEDNLDRYTGTFKLQFDQNNPPLMPSRTDRAELSVTAEPSWPNMSAQNCVNEYDIIIRDNDAPEIEIILSKSNSELARLSVKDGITDIPFNKSGKIKIKNDDQEFEIDDPYSRGLEEAMPSETSSISLDLCTVLSDSSKWIKVVEDTRIHVKLGITDNFDSAPMTNGKNIKSIICNSKAITTKSFPLIFRDSGLRKKALEIQVIDMAGNIRKVTFPINVIDTKINIETMQ